MNQHCGKHDKIFDEDNPCPGCVTEQSQQILGPDDTLAEKRGVDLKKKRNKDEEKDEG